MYIMLTIKAEDTVDFLKHLECLQKVTKSDICTYDNGYNEITVDKLGDDDIINLVNYALRLHKEEDLCVWEERGGRIIATFNNK